MRIFAGFCVLLGGWFLGGSLLAMFGMPIILAFSISAAFVIMAFGFIYLESTEEEESD